MAKFNLGDWGEEDVAAIYGIVSEVNIVKLCFHLNKHMHFGLLRAEHDKPGIGKNKEYRYPHFAAYDAYLDVTWHLVSNRNPYPINNSEIKQAGLFTQTLMSGAPLVRSLKMLDYLFWCSGEVNGYFDATFNIQLKSIPYVRAIQKLNMDAYKGLDILTTE